MCVRGSSFGFSPPFLATVDIEGTVEMVDKIELVKTAVTVDTLAMIVGIGKTQKRIYKKQRLLSQQNL